MHTRSCQALPPCLPLRPICSTIYLCGAFNTACDVRFGHLCCINKAQVHNVLPFKPMRTESAIAERNRSSQNPRRHSDVVSLAPQEILSCSWADLGDSQRLQPYSIACACVEGGNFAEGHAEECRFTESRPYCSVEELLSPVGLSERLHLRASGPKAFHSVAGGCVSRCEADGEIRLRSKLTAVAGVRMLA